MANDSMRCYHCNKPFPSEAKAAECYCYGCEEHICDDCDKSMGSLGRHHDPDDHLEESED